MIAAISDAALRRIAALRNRQRSIIAALVQNLERRNVERLRIQLKK
jgi:hypothetical protein